MSRAKGLLKRFMHELTKEELCSVPDELQTEIEELLAQPEQEPVAWMNDSGGCFLSDGNKYSENWTALYTSAQKRTPLSNEEIDKGLNGKNGFENWYDDRFVDGVRFAEKHHGIGVDDE